MLILVFVVFLSDCQQGIPKILMQLNSPNLPYKCHADLFIYVKGQGHAQQKQCLRVFWHSCECWLIVV